MIVRDVIMETGAQSDVKKWSKAKEFRWFLKPERQGNAFSPKAYKRRIALPAPWF